jgi:hypothetical protein
MTDTLTLWHDSRRPESWAGEIRVNLVRLLAIALFYGRHLLEVMLSGRDSPLRGRYHLAVTMVVIVWVFEAVVLHLWLSRRFYAEWIKYAAVLWDAMMITTLCAVAGGGGGGVVFVFFFFFFFPPPPPPTPPASGFLPCLPENSDHSHHPACIASFSPV